MANGLTEARDREIARLEEEMMRWTKGTMSHWNYYQSAALNGNGERDAALASVMCSIADAAEVQKLSFAIQALRAGQ